MRDDLDVCLFPDKPDAGKRELPLLGATVSLHLRSAKVGTTTFAFGSAPLPPELDADDAKRQNVVRAFEESLLRNVGSAQLQHEGTAPVKAWASVRLPLPRVARQIDASGTTPEGARRIMARFYVVGGRFIELIVIGDPKGWPAQEVDTFLENYRPA
jgi:hypothetical protein